jgi:putative aldouronate transport system permease protein
MIVKGRGILSNAVKTRSDKTFLGMQLVSHDKIRRIKKYRVLYLFMLPGFLGLLLFNYAPMLGLTMVFQDYNPISGFLGSPWAGLNNFKILFASPVFVRALRNTAIISFLKLAIGFPLPIIFALLFNELRSSKLRRAVQGFSYLPYFVSWVIVAGIWYKMLSPDDGIINQILLSAGIVDQPVFFMQNKILFYVVILFTDIWKNLGYSSIYYLAAIACIDIEQYEAAIVDGAGRFKQAIYITLPGMKPTIILLLILSVSNLLSAGFDQLYTMDNLAVREVSDILDTAVVRYLTTGSIQDLSIGAALGFFKSIIGVLLFVGANMVAKAAKQESII